MELCGIYKKGRENVFLNESEMFVEGMNAYDDSEYVEALEWFLKAAERDHAEAQFACGYMYDKGRGTAANTEKALHWYRKAAERGHEKAQQMLDKLTVKQKNVLAFCAYFRYTTVVNKSKSDGTGRKMPGPVIFLP